jgi:hypothetical protein
VLYALNLVSFCTACLMQILDLVPTVARLYFLERLPASLSYGQAAILLCLGLQHQQLEHLEVLGVSSIVCGLCQCYLFSGSGLVHCLG